MDDQQRPRPRPKPASSAPRPRSAKSSSVRPAGRPSARSAGAVRPRSGRARPSAKSRQQGVRSGRSRQYDEDYDSEYNGYAPVGGGQDKQKQMMIIGGVVGGVAVLFLLLIVIASGSSQSSNAGPSGPMVDENKEYNHACDLVTKGERAQHQYEQARARGQGGRAFYATAHKNFSEALNIFYKYQDKYEGQGYSGLDQMIQHTQECMHNLTKDSVVNIK